MFASEGQYIYLLTHASIRFYHSTPQNSFYGQGSHHDFYIESRIKHTFRWIFEDIRRFFILIFYFQFTFKKTINYAKSSTKTTNYNNQSIKSTKKSSGTTYSSCSCELNRMTMFHFFSSWIYIQVYLNPPYLLYLLLLLR
jgi:hypothetical protein